MTTLSIHDLGLCESLRETFWCRDCHEALHAQLCAPTHAHEARDAIEQYTLIPSNSPQHYNLSIYTLDRP